jgi:hypothetical protein
MDLSLQFAVLFVCKCFFFLYLKLSIFHDYSNLYQCRKLNPWFFYKYSFVLSMLLYLSFNFFAELDWQWDWNWCILHWGIFNLCPNIWEPSEVWPLKFMTQYKPERYCGRLWPLQRSFTMFQLKSGCCLFWQVLFYSPIIVIVCRSHYFIRAGVFRWDFTLDPHSIWRKNYSSFRVCLWKQSLLDQEL